jgi:hypothetical protein
VSATRTGPPPIVSPAFRGVGSPGVGGYVLAWLASAVALPLVLLLGVLLPGGERASLSVTEVIPTLGFALVFAMAAAVYGAPAALVGCLVVHLVCLRVDSQAVHVAAAAAAGLVTGWGYDTWLFQGSWDWLWLQLGIATAVGRAVVIPLVRRRR